MTKKIASLELTDTEAKTITQFLRTTPIQGNLETLPTILAQVAGILKKIEIAFQDDMPPLKEEKKRGRASR